MKKVVLIVGISVILLGLFLFIEGEKGTKKYLSSLGTRDVSFSFITSEEDFTRLKVSDMSFLSFNNYIDDSFRYYDYVAERRTGFIIVLLGGLFLLAGLQICSVSEKIDLMERSIRKKIEESKNNDSGSVVKKAYIQKSNDDGKYTWRCGNCGKVNRIGIQYCVVCDNPYYNSNKPSSPSNVGPISHYTNEESIRRAYRLLGDGDFEGAERVFDTVLALKPDDSQACFGKLMCQHKTKTISVVRNLNIDSDALYQKVKPFATEEFFDQIRKLLN